jgi:hypothetical protein
VIGYTRVLGSLVLEGYDRSRGSLPTLQIPFTSDTIVGVQQIVIKAANGSSTSLLTRGILATIETNVPEIGLPASVCDAFASALGLTFDAASDRYVFAVNEVGCSIPTLTST